MIIGRTEEIQLLSSLLDSQKCEFVVLYGRRRIGKTFLIDQTFKENIYFRHTGAEPLEEPSKDESKMQRQLDAFQDSLIRFGAPKHRGRIKTWREAFLHLEELLNLASKERRHVVFIDEMPWMDTPKSGFVAAFTDFYNGYFCHLDNMILVVCGSASSWLVKKILRGTKGIYRRVTRTIRLRPFSLAECKAFLETKRCPYSEYEVALAYMAFGGIPYYLDFFQPFLSVKANIDRLLFGPERVMEDEFDDLFTAQFSSPKTMRRIIEFLSTRNMGYTADDIARELETKKNGRFFAMLKALERSGFIMKYVPFGNSVRDVRYKLIDAFCLFYLKRVKGNENKKNYFVNASNSPIGLSFENLCINHLEQIERKLGISGIETEASFFFAKKHEGEVGAQIDLVIRRKDDGINLCEIKFYSGEYSCSEKSHVELANKMAAIAPYIGRKSSIYPVLITTFGLAKGAYSGDYPSVVTLSDFFK